MPVRGAALLCALLVMAAARLHAQAGTIAGTVQDESGAPLAGAQVFVSGTERGARTDPAGRFQITGVAPGQYSIEVRRLGYRTATRVVQIAGGTTNLAFQLAVSPLSIDAVVVTGQGGEISSRRISTNVEVISEEEIQASNATRLDQLVQGALPNVQVRLGSGQPGATATMRGRGPVSVSRSTTPVIYVDGVRVDNLNTRAELSMSVSGPAAQGTQTSSIADIPLENIERIEYIPGGAATTLYGSDAANGVIQIFTNKGTAGRAQFSYEAEAGVEQVDPRYFYFDETVDVLYRNGGTQTHRVTGSGGNENVTWSVSGSVADREGFRVANNASRSYQGRTGLSANISSSLNYEGSFGYSWNAYERARDGNAGGYTALWLLEGGRIRAFHGFNNNLDKLTAAGRDSLGQFVSTAESLQNYGVEVARFQTSQAFRWQPTPDLNFRTTFGLDQRVSNERAIVTNQFLIFTQQRPAGTDDRGSINQYDRRFLGLTGEATGQYSYETGPLSVITNFGGQIFRNDDAQASRSASNVREGSETVRGAGSVTADDYFLTLVNYGGFAQQNWGLFNRYFVEVGLRADGNSAFGDEVGWQYYPKVGVSYDLGSEPFVENLIPSNLLSSLRIRGNYGVAGNFPPAYSRDRTITFNSYLGQQTASFGQPGDQGLKPEKTSTWEVGAEMEALDGRLAFEFTGYRAVTRDALMNAPSVPSAGESSQLHNVGEILNRGIELRLTAEVLRTDALSLSLGGAYNTLHNEVISTGGLPPFQLTGFGSTTVETVVAEGFPVGFLRGTQATIENGQLTGWTDLQYLGKPLPDRFGSLNADLTFRGNLKLSADADWQTGAQMHSFNRQFRYNHDIVDPELPDAVNALPRSTNWLRLTSEFVEPADYLKIRNVSASYSLPADLRTSWLRGVDLSLGVQNPYGWWTSSFDPESETSGATTQGGASVGGFNYAVDPAPRRFVGSVRLRF